MSNSPVCEWTGKKFISFLPPQQPISIIKELRAGYTYFQLVKTKAVCQGVVSATEGIESFKEMMAVTRVGWGSYDSTVKYILL